MAVPEIELSEFAALHARGVAVIDVRNPGEYLSAHVPGAVLIPLPEVADRVAEVPDGVPVYVVCAMGGRSRKACEILGAHGRDVTNVTAGTLGWIEAGLPVNDGDVP